MHRLADSSMVKRNSDTNKTNDPDTNKTDEDLESHETGSFKPDWDSVKFSPDINSIASSAVIPVKYSATSYL